MMSKSDLFECIGNFAYDLRNLHWSKAKLAKVCKKEAKALDLGWQDLVRRVNSAYLAKFY